MLRISTLGICFYLAIDPSTLVHAQNLPSSETESILRNFPVVEELENTESVSTFFVKRTPSLDKVTPECRWAPVAGYSCGLASGEPYVAAGGEIPWPLNHSRGLTILSTDGSTVGPNTMDYTANIKEDLKNPWVTLNSDGEPEGQIIPFVVPDTLLIQVSPNLTESELKQLISDWQLQIFETIPEIGTVRAKTDLSRFFENSPEDESANDALARGLQNIRDFYGQDERVQTVSPDLVLRPDFSNENLLFAIDKVSGIAEGSHWGLLDIEVEIAWSEPGADDGIVFGVVDIGFSRHEDITFAAGTFDPKVVRHDHGNHVAAIACGDHNGIGVKGVIPNCFVRAASGNVFGDEAPTATTGALTSLGASAAKLVKLVTDEDIRTYNVSMGIAWSKLGVNIDAASSEIWRNQVVEDANLIMAIYELAAERDKVIFSAAGNDGLAFGQEINSDYASPFNLAAKEMQRKGIYSGVIVEAHSEAGIRAGFSNVGGNISCPGVDVLSAVSFDNVVAAADDHYGTMSGTSMATPYCAASHSLLSLLRPNYSSQELVGCMLSSTPLSSSGVPMFRFSDALTACPPKNSDAMALLSGATTSFATGNAARNIDCAMPETDAESAVCQLLSGN